MILQSEELRTWLMRYTPDCKIIEIDYLTEGPACSALLFEEDIDNQDELIIANCDQIMTWNSEQFLAKGLVQFLEDFCSLTNTDMETL